MFAKPKNVYWVSHDLQMPMDASREGMGTHLGDITLRGTWSIPESKLHIYNLELKAVFLALKEFQDLCSNKIVLIAIHNTTVVAYINTGGMRSSPFCVLLFGILTLVLQEQVTLKAQHIPQQLNVVADNLSRLSQIIQTEWSVFLEVFKLICIRWH